METSEVHLREDVANQRCVCLGSSFSMFSMYILCVCSECVFSLQGVSEF